MRFVFENCESIIIPDADINYYSLYTSGEYYVQGVSPYKVVSDGVILVNKNALESAQWESTSFDNEMKPIERLIQYQDITFISINGTEFCIKWGEEDQYENTRQKAFYSPNGNLTIAFGKEAE